MIVKHVTYKPTLSNNSLKKKLNTIEYNAYTEQPKSIYLYKYAAEISMHHGRTTTNGRNQATSQRHCPYLKPLSDIGPVSQIFA
jgi:hypothetical protein